MKEGKGDVVKKNGSKERSRKRDVVKGYWGTIDAWKDGRLRGRKESTEKEDG